MRIFALLIALSIGLCVFMTAQADDRTPAIAIIIPADQTPDALKLSPSTLKLIYLRKQLYWPNGKRIYPVNLQTEHTLRRVFSLNTLGSLPAAQIDYWNGLYFNGIRPPHVVNSEEAVIRYIAQTPGSIGYIDACKVDDRVQPLLWLNDDHITAVLPENLDCH